LKITLLKSLGNVGVITEWKPLISSAKFEMVIDGGSSGALTIGGKVYAVRNGNVSFPEYELLLGANKVTYADEHGNAYDCGVIRRHGGFIEVVDDIRDIVVRVAIDHEKQAREIVELAAKIKTIKEQYGISII
jgi:hypothetical protein